jgi:V8-like Glu-specific endopeptidase
MDECAVIERQVEKDKDSVRYIAVGLRAKRVAEVKALILELDKCILANNRPAAVQEWLADQELEYSYDEQEQFYEDSERDDGALDEETEPEFFSESQFLSEDELGIIGGRDDRAPVADTQAAPFRWICSVAVQRRIKTAATERKTGLAPAGTGFLISPRHVLTAAHLLRSVKKDDQGGITERHEALLVAVKPGRDGDAAPFGAIEAKSWTPHPKWNPEGNTPQYDYAVITLNEAVGDRTFKNLKDESLCFWGSPKCGANTLLDNLPSAVARGLVGMRVVTAGYPDEAKGQMWCAAGTVSAGSPELDSLLNRGGRVEDWAKRARTISVTTDASEGQSGSPVWVVNNGKRYLVGILVSIAKHYNQVVNLNSDVVRQIQSWIANAAIGAKKQNLLDEPDVRSSETGEFESTEDAPDRLEVADAAHNCPTCATHYHEHELYESEESAETEERAGLESDEEAFDWLMDGSSEEELESEEEESVEVEWDTQKGESKKSSLHKVPTSNIFMHVYFNNLATTFSAQQFFDWVVGQSPDAMGPNRFQNEGVEIHLVNNSATAVSDLKGTLKTAGSVVVYFGHTVLGPKTTLGLAPSDPPAKKPGITCADLTKLLNTAKAKIVVLAGCATSQCVTKIKGDTVVIVTQSGPNRVTNTLQWAPAIKTLLDELLAAATVGDALDAANKIFAKHSSTDSFKRINGDPTLRMIQPAAEP